MNYDSVAKIVLLGSSGSGKSSLMSAYDDEPFNQDNLATIGVDFKLKYETRGDDRIMIQINDTAGQERFESITVSYLRGASGILLVFDLTDDNSFYSCEKWKDHIARMAPPNIPFILIGNKKDLESRRVIQHTQAKEMATRIGADLYFETSARTSENVKEVFSEILDLVLKNETLYQKLKPENEGRWDHHFPLSDPKKRFKEDSFLKKALSSLKCNIL